MIAKAVVQLPQPVRQLTATSRHLPAPLASIHSSGPKPPVVRANSHPYQFESAARSDDQFLGTSLSEQDHFQVHGLVEDLEKCIDINEPQECFALVASDS
jgi:hypothetical protein